MVDNVGMFYHNYDALLTNVLNGLAYDFNTTHASGIDLTKNNLTLKFISGLVRASIITPFQEDGFLFAGFKWITDI